VPFLSEFLSLQAVHLTIWGSPGETAVSGRRVRDRMRVEKPQVLWAKIFVT